MATVEPNHAAFGPTDLAAVFGPAAASALPADWVARGVTTDSRRPLAGTLFIALEGERHDGHTFAAAALAAGAAGVVVRAGHPTTAGLDGTVIAVGDTLVALGDLARHHRRRFPGPVVAIGGAMGKTSTKELAVAACSPTARVHATAGNNNNRIGVPLTLLQLDTAAHDVGIIEIGTDQPGEVAELARITEPSHGLITNIAEEHLDRLGDLDGVEHEETALFRALDARGAGLLVNVDDARLRPWSRVTGALTFGTDATARIRGRISLEWDATARLRIDDQTIALQTLGFGMARNALAAAAIASALDVPLDVIAGALAGFVPRLDPAGYARMTLEARRGVRFLVDCYNASPGGMHEALDVLMQLPVDRGARRVAVVGDMLELGAVSAARHAEVLDRVLGTDGPDAVHVVGPAFTAAARGRRSGRLTVHPSRDDCLHALRSSLQPGDVALFKASHGVGLERVVRALLTDD